MITIYSRPGCHLCDEMKLVVERLMRLHRPDESLEIIDISNNPDLEARYGIEIPVLIIDGKKTAKYRVTEGELTRMLKRRAGGAGQAGSAGG